MMAAQTAPAAYHRRDDRNLCIGAQRRVQAILGANVVSLEKDVNPAAQLPVGFGQSLADARSTRIQRGNHAYRRFRLHPLPALRAIKAPDLDRNPHRDHHQPATRATLTEKTDGK
jgi:hypothetical protein